MVIDRDTYKLEETNYYHSEFKKNQIIIGNSFSENNNHIKGWLSREGGNYKKTASFSINKEGKIYEHFNPQYYSDFTNNKLIDKKSISIIIENLGWLQKDLINDKYIDWVGNIYNRSNDIIEKRWRGFTYWDSYSDEQMNSCVELVNYLCDKFNIEKNCVTHNTYIEGIEYFDGIVYKSNYHKESTDLSPAWDFKKFKEKTEKYEPTR